MHSSSPATGVDPVNLSASSAAAGNPGHGAGPGKVVVFYTADKKKFELAPGTYTIEQLKTELGVPAGYVLELFAQGHFEELKGPIELKSGMHFNSFVPTGESA